MSHFNVTMPLKGKATIMVEADNKSAAIETALEDWDADCEGYDILEADREAPESEFKVEPCNEDGEPLPIDQAEGA